MLEHSDEDRAVIEAQVGRPMRGSWGVARRCHLGVPMVIESHPRLDDGAPFPTTFWLTCPMLVKRASMLESEGWMGELNVRLTRDASLSERLASAIARYRARRDALEVIADSGSPPGGGPDRVKCLHAHTAHQLADPPNPVGSLTLGLSGWPDCRIPCYEIAAPPKTDSESP